MINRISETVGIKILVILLFSVEIAWAQLAILATTSLPNNIYGVSITSQLHPRIPKVALFWDVKGYFSDPRDFEDKETYDVQTFGLRLIVRTNLAFYVGVGPASRKFMRNEGVGHNGQIEYSNRNEFGRNFGAGVLFGVFTPTSRSKLIFQAGIETMPMGLVLGIGRSFRIPFFRHPS